MTRRGSKSAVLFHGIELHHTSAPPIFWRNAAIGEVPIGAVIVYEDKIIARGYKPADIAILGRTGSLLDQRAQHVAVEQLEQDQPRVRVHVQYRHGAVEGVRKARRPDGVAGIAQLRDRQHEAEALVQCMQRPGQLVLGLGHHGLDGQRFLQLGIHPGGGHTWMLQRRVGPQAAAAMVLFGQILDGRQAADAGLAWACVPDDELLATARQMAAASATAPRELVGRIKATMADVRALDDHTDAVERELDPQVWSINQPAFQEKLAALQQRISSKG